LNCTERGIIVLIKAAVDGRTYSLPEGFSLSEALPLVKKHHIVPIVYEGALLCGISKDDASMKEMFLNYCKNSIISEGQLKEIGRIYAAFDRDGIDYIPIKGCELKLLYPKPEMRPMGDADILVRSEQINKAEVSIASLGFKKKNEWGGVNTWDSKDLHLELHHMLMPDYTKDLYRYFKDPWKNAVSSEGHRYKKTHGDSFIFLFVHFAKHYRGGGIGLRHVLDLYVYRKAYEDIDENYIKNEINSLGLSEFYDNISRLIEYWFYDAESDEMSEFISSYIFGSGSWGKRESVVLSNEILHKKSDEKRGNVKLKLFFRVLFPSAKTLSGKYRILKKLPVLLPFVWVYRVFEKLFTDRAIFKKRTADLIYISDEKIDEQEKLMNSMGLYFDFGE